MVVSLHLPSLGNSGVVQGATAFLAVCIHDVEFGNVARGWIGNVDDAGEGIDSPDLLAGGGNQDSHRLARVAYAQEKRVPFAVDSHPVLGGRDREGRWDGRDTRPQFVVWGFGDVLLFIAGGDTGQQ